MLIRQRLLQYSYLMRLDKPIGILLLLWPTLWALWLAAQGKPDRKVLCIFITGVVLMRSAGCVINDLTDRHIDGFVQRTHQRPLPSGSVTPKEALVLAAILLMLAFLLVLLTNHFTIQLAFVGAILTLIYPMMKRFTYLPQCGLGLAFSWGMPMAFAAQRDSVTFSAWFLFFTGLIWPIIYDTLYAMVDREDDLKINVKSTAILFNTKDKFIIACLQLIFLIMLVIVGMLFQLHQIYYFSLLIVFLLFIYQQWLIKKREPQQCFQAFLNNNYVGFVIFCGICLSYLQ
ncbi:MAG: 4-hydroxybenzoate octaprenyltransferase [Gammaproteobacteria bacterium]|nr:4-hydroxybenzoate octaprenyltransferase [Gammaproteobacteria bacterium]